MDINTSPLTERTQLPKEDNEHYFDPKPTRPTDQVQDPDSGLADPVREPTQNCTTKFVIGLFSRE